MTFLTIVADIVKQYVIDEKQEQPLRDTAKDEQQA